MAALKWSDLFQGEDNSLDAVAPTIMGMPVGRPSVAPVPGQTNWGHAVSGGLANVAAAFPRPGSNPLIDWLNSSATPPPKASPEASLADGFEMIPQGQAGAATARPGGGVDYHAMAVALAPAFKTQESHGEAGAVGQPTKYGRALGSMQVLPSTAQSLAKKYGFTYDQTKMTGTDAASAQYQEMVGTYAIQDALEQSGGDVKDAAKVYFAGPDPKNQGPKTQQYANDMMGRISTMPGNPFQLPDQQVVTPQGAMSFMDQAAPQMVPGMTLPEAPQREMPTPLPENLEGPSRAGLDQLAQTFMPKERDKSKDGTDKLQAFLSNAAIAASQLGPHASAGQIILAAGGGGTAGLRQAKQHIEAQDKANDELIRQFGLTMGLKGEDIADTQRQFRNSMQERHAQNLNEMANTMFANATARFNRDVAQAESTQRTAATNVGATNEFRRAKATVGLNALGQEVETTNKAGLAQNELDRAAFAAERDPTKRTAMAYNLMGVNPDAPAKDLVQANAIATAPAIAQGSLDQAVGGLVRESLLTGDWKQTFTTPDVQKAIGELLSGRKSPTGKPDIEGAYSLAMNALNAAPGPARTSSLNDLARAAAKNGHPVATGFTKLFRPKVAVVKVPGAK